MDPDIDAYFERVDKISQFAVQIRYPDAIIMLSKDQIAAAIVTAEMMLNLVNEKIR